MSALPPQAVPPQAPWAGWQVPAGPVVRRYARLANGRRWGLYLSLTVLFCLVAMVWMRELTSLIRGMQLPGEPSASLRRLASNPDQVKEVVAVWRRFAEAAGPQFASARFVASLRLASDVVFVFGYVTLAGLMLLRTQVRTGLREAIRSSALRRALAAGLGRRASEDEADRVAAEQSGAFNFALDLTFLAVLGLGLVSWIGDGLVWKVLRAYWDASPGDPAGAGWPLLVGLARMLLVTKWVLVGLIAIPLVTFAVRFAIYKLGTIGASLRLVRIQLILVVAFAVLAMLPVQMPDVILRLSAGQFGATVAMTAAFGMVSWAFSRRLVLHAHWRRTHPGPAPSVNPQIGLTVMGVTVGVCATAARLVTLVGGRAGPVLVPLGLAGALIGLGWIIGEVPEDRRRAHDAGVGGDVLPRLMAASALAVVGVAIVKATTGPMVYRRRWDELFRLGWGPIAMAAGLVLFAVLHRLDDREEEAEWKGWWRGSLRWIAIAAALPVVAFWGLVFVSPWRVPQAISALGVVVIFLTSFALITGTMTIAAEWSAERYGVPQVLRLLRLRTIPVLSLLLVWALVAGKVNGTDHLLVRIRDGGRSASGLTLQQAFDAWAQANGAGPRSLPRDASERRAVPLILIGAAGGGLRAATWTGYVMDCLFEADPVLDSCRDPADPAGGRLSSRAFLGSGVSGGSLGLAEYATHVVTEADAGGGDWVSTRLGDDYLSPAVAWGLFVEFPRIFFGYNAMDRAEVMERAWERSWGGDGPDTPLGAGFLQSQSSAPASGVPFLVLNGTSVRDGCLMNTSILETALDDGASAGRGADRLKLVGGCQSLEPFTEPSPSVSGSASNANAVLPGATDLLDFLCSNQDVAMSTAALLSARFPGASPSGRLEACGRDRAGVKFIVDGGYVEPSGAETVMSLWPHLDEIIEAHNRASDRTCVVPFYVQIDNRYIKPPAPPKTSSPNELLAPAAALRASVLASRAQRAQAAAAFVFAKPSPEGVRLDGVPVPDRFAYLVPLAHPGVEAPLGWSLSDAAEEDLRTQLLGQRNLAEVREIRSWLTGSLTCAQA